MMQNISDSNFYIEMIDALNMLGFETLEMDFFRRVDEIEEDGSSLIMYLELNENTAELNIYKDALMLLNSNIESPIEFIDRVESHLNMFGIESAELVPLDSSIIIDGKPITAAENKLSTKDMMKKMIRVRSSNLWSYAFQPKDYNAGTMLIQFKGTNGGPNDVYVYYDIPNKLWQKFVAAPSKGHFFWQYIRNVFKYSKLTGDKRTRLKNGV